MIIDPSRPGVNTEVNTKDHPLRGQTAVVTGGGRVLSVTAVADTLQQALDRAYQSLNEIHFEGIYFRHDIGHRALKLAK